MQHLVSEHLTSVPLVVLLLSPLPRSSALHTSCQGVPVVHVHDTHTAPPSMAVLPLQVQDKVSLLARTLQAVWA
jgi:hypothetical protein